MLCVQGPRNVFFFATTQLARQVHQERTHVVCSNNVKWMKNTHMEQQSNFYR